MSRRAYLRAALAAVLDGLADRITATADTIAPRTTAQTLPADYMTPDPYQPINLWPASRCGSPRCTCATDDYPLGEYPPYP